MPGQDIHTSAATNARTRKSTEYESISVAPVSFLHLKGPGRALFRHMQTHSSMNELFPQIEEIGENLNQDHVDFDVDAQSNIVGLFDLLLKIDRRNHPEFYA